MDIVNVHSLCRTCTGESIDMTRITSSLLIENRVVMLSEILELFIDKPKTSFPTSICHLCVEKAIVVYNFKMVCDKSTKFFKNCIKNESDSNDLVIPVGIDLNCNDAEHTKLSNDTVSKKPVGKYNLKLEDIGEPNSVADNIISSNFGDRMSCEISDCKTELLSRHNNNNNEYHNDMIEHEDTPIPKNAITKCDSEIGTLAISNISSKRKKRNGKTQMKYINEDLLFCAQCNKSFKNKYILISHIRRHKNKGKFLCTVCGKGFNAQSCLSRHAKIHTGEKKYECEVCRKKFLSSNNLKIHSRRHSGVKPYLCTLCGKCFSQPTGLTYHNRTHTKEKPYACDVCDRRFTIQCHRDRHRKTHSGERPFACDMCDRAFIKKFDLQRHQDVHLGNKPYTCSICKKAFVRKMHLDYHVMVHTKERPHVCSHCGKGFIRRYYLTSHVKKHHMMEFEENDNNTNVDEINDGYK